MSSGPVRDQDTIRFGEDFEVDLRSYKLHRNGRVLELERIPMEILLFLLEQRDRIVTPSIAAGVRAAAGRPSTWRWPLTGCDCRCPDRGAGLAPQRDGSNLHSSLLQGPLPQGPLYFC